MAIVFEIEHVTNYKYANTVTFDTHRAMFLPRPAAQGRLQQDCKFAAMARAQDVPTCLERDYRKPVRTYQGSGRRGQVIHTQSDYVAAL